MEVMRGDLRGSTAFSAACFGHGWPLDGQETMLGPDVELRPDWKVVAVECQPVAASSDWSAPVSLARLALNWGSCR